MSGEVCLEKEGKVKKKDKKELDRLGVVRDVREPNVDIKNTFLKFVLDRVHDFPAKTAIPLAGNEVANG